MSTTLPLFWNLSSSSKKERIDASVKLIGALERFQAEFTPQENTSDDEEDDDMEGEREKKKDGLDALNAADVSYSIRRLVRGLASPRESSRLGFAVALTELLLRINTVTCSQVLSLIVDASRTSGSMTGQEERDVLFARLFGLTAVIQSGLIVRDTLLSSSASSSTTVSDASTFASIVSHFLSLSESKSWLRESTWWSFCLAVDRLGDSDVSWRVEAFDSIIDIVYVKNKVWTPEKVALTVRLQKWHPSADWKQLLSPTFKHAQILASGNFVALARILKDTAVDDDETAGSKSNTGLWTPNVPFVWDILLDQVLSNPNSAHSASKSFPEFFRILVDESLFAASSSAERKYWGFQVFRKSLSRASAADTPMLFTKNFMRTWINHLSNSDRYLHKAAKQVASDILGLVKKDPTLGFTLILQLTGVNGSQQFDRLTKTKTVETILTSLDADGIEGYIDSLLQQVNDKDGNDADNIPAINGRRLWIVDQLAALIRNGAIAKNDVWVQRVLNWLLVHGLSTVRKKSEKSNLVALHAVPTPMFSDDLHKACRSRLLSCLAELTGHASLVQVGDKPAKVTAVATDGQLWVSKCLLTVDQLLEDTKHLKWLVEIDEDQSALRQSAVQLSRRLSKITGDQEDLARGTELLLSASLLHAYCTDPDDDESDEDSDTLQECVDATRRLFPEKKKQKKTNEVSHAEPLDILVDIIIQFLEKGTLFMRTVSNQAFTLLSGSLQSSSIDLIVAQLVSRDPEELADGPDDAMDEDPASEDDAKEDSDSDEDEDEDDDDEGDLEENSQLRAAIEEALGVNGLKVSEDDEDEDSDEELMDDDQMLAIDEQLAAVFKARAEEKGRGRTDVQREATHFKNRVLDLVDVYLKKHASSPHAIRVVSPLVEIITGSGSDEKQLTDKATAILRSRLGKTKETPSITEKDDAVRILQELHLRARTAVSSDILATLSSCSLYICRGLLHAEAQEQVVETYRESLKDFMTRKASRLNNHIFQDFFRRYPAVAWELRQALIEFSGVAVNGYRKAQAYQLLQAIMNQLSVLHDRNADILSFMPLLSKSIEDVVSAACEDGSLTAAQAKEVLKLAQSATRQTKRVATTAQDTSTIWKPSRWQSLAQKLATSDTLKSSTGLQNICKQIAQLAESATTNTLGKATQESSKRKVNADTEEDGGAKAAKRKKAKRTKV
ncbi:DNA polymerase phi-domain-containing protein [Cristinia sonorae]|uniref:DNA polymerase phi-domain-containing protein n=1 Tax=Cristinia sonorae TaxID=1940300 RepID=A0A8K0UYY7_9AGAR|nr:DNA polymerase phi-domain-containing protein [Cristinia sonorae]